METVISAVKAKVKMFPWVGKVMVMKFLNSNGILIKYFVEAQTVNETYYATILDKLKVAITGKKPTIVHSNRLSHING